MPTTTLAALIKVLTAMQRLRATGLMGWQSSCPSQVRARGARKWHTAEAALLLLGCGGVTWRTHARRDALCRKRDAVNARHGRATAADGPRAVPRGECCPARGLRCRRVQRARLAASARAVLRAQILYDPEPSMIRAIELARAARRRPMQVYFLMQSDSVEEQKYRSALRAGACCRGGAFCWGLRWRSTSSACLGRVRGGVCLVCAYRDPDSQARPCVLGDTGLGAAAGHPAGAPYRRRPRRRGPAAKQWSRQRAASF